MTTEPLSAAKTEEINVNNFITKTVFLMSLSACASTPCDAPVDPSNVLTREAEAQVYVPIRLPRDEFLSLSKMSREMIAAHNNVYWCRLPATRPQGFDESICAQE